MGISVDIQRLQVDARVNLYAIVHDAIGIRRFTPSIKNNRPFLHYQGYEYQAIPIELTGTSRSTQPQKPTLKISNTTAAFSAPLWKYDNLLGAVLLWTVTFEKYLDGEPDADPNQHFPTERFTLERKSSQRPGTVEWELAAALDLDGVKIPRRKVQKDICDHYYRIWNIQSRQFDYSKTTCPYKGAAYYDLDGNRTAYPMDDNCGKKLSDCALRFGDTTILPYAAFPGIAVL
jgi:lambda family phage minor tail protein L